MKVEVRPTAAPPQRVVLDLSVEEFALVFRLYFKNLDGSGQMRTQFEEGMHAALDDLAESNQQKVTGVARFRGNCITAVEEWFRS